MDLDLAGVLELLRDALPVIDISAGPSRLDEYRAYIEKLPHLTEKDIIDTQWKNDSCPICFNSFLAIIAEEEMASVMDSPGATDLGLTKLEDTCNHIFCRKDIVKWITEGHHKCPACRQSFLPARNDDSASGSGNMTEEEATAANRATLDPLLSAISQFEREQRTPGQPNTAGGVFIENRRADEQPDFTGMYS